MKEPIIRGAGAFLYVLAVATLISSLEALTIEPPPVFAITAFLSLFTFSAAVMGFLFFWKPGQLFLAGHAKEATAFFLRTLGTFAVLMLCLAGAVFFVSAA